MLGSLAAVVLLMTVANASATIVKATRLQLLSPADGRPTFGNGPHPQRTLEQALQLCKTDGGRIDETEPAPLVLRAEPQLSSNWGSKQSLLLGTERATTLKEINSIGGWQAAREQATARGRVHVLAVSSDSADRAVGPQVYGMVQQFGDAKMDFAKVTVKLADLAPNAARTNPHAQLVRRLKDDGRLMLPALVITGGRDKGRYMRAAGVHEFRQALADSAHRNAHGVRHAVLHRPA